VSEVWDELGGRRPEPERDQYGRYLAVDPTDNKSKPWTRATTVAATLADKYALNLWSQRMTAIGLARRPDLYARVAATPVDERDQLNRLVEEAKEAAAATAGANLGTALHTFTMRLDLGEDVVAPPPWDKDLAAYRTALDTAGVQVVPGMVEQVVLLPDLQIAGTFDRLASCAGRPLPMVADLKTGSFLPWDEISIQLALYAHAACIWNTASKRHEPYPQVDQEQALVIWLPAGQARCELHLVDIAAGWEAVRVAMWVRDWRKRKDLVTPLTAVEIPAPPSATPDDGGMRAEHARQRLVRLADLGAPVMWPTGVQSFKEQRLSKHVYTHDELLAIEAALSQAEKQVDAPFPPPEPDAHPNQVAVMAARLEALPADLLERAVAECKPHAIPHLRRGRLSIRHVEILETIVGPLEMEAAERANSARGLLGEYGDDPGLGRLILQLAGCTDLATVDDTARTRIAAVVGGLDDGLLAVHVADDGTETLVPTVQAEALLTGLGENRAQVLLAVKPVADAHGISRPRSFAVAASDPLLVALVAAQARQPA